MLYDPATGTDYASKRDASRALNAAIANPEDVGLVEVQISKSPEPTRDTYYRLADTTDWDADTKTATRDWVAVARTPEEIAGLNQSLAKGLNSHVDIRIEAGTVFTINADGGGTRDIPLTGRAADQSVYLAQLIRAQGLKAAGVTAPVMVLRDRDNATQSLTPDEMMELVAQAMSWVEATRLKAWNMKDGVAPYQDGVPLDYKDDSHWA